MIRKLIATAILLIAIRSLAYEPFKSAGLETVLSQQKPPAIALEEPIDRDSYMLGPGDVLEFSVWGPIELHHLIEVAPDGSIIIPNVGDLSVAGLPLGEVEESVIKLAKPMYAKSRLSLRIVAIRRMKVTVSGTGFQSGIVTVSAIDRLSTVLTLAAAPLSSEGENGVSAVPAEEAETKKSAEQERWIAFEDVSDALPALRKISITDRDGDVRVVDFLKFQRTGDRLGNPVLKDGDRIHIPPMTDSSDVVHILGGVMLPGRLEFLTGDRLRDIVDLAGGFRKGAVLSTITIFRSTDSDPTIKSQSIVVRLSEKDNDRGLELRSGDRILIRTADGSERTAFVKISGEVVHPGIYPIENLVSTLRELILSNGGFSDRSDLKNAKLIRWSKADRKDPEFDRLEKLSVDDMTKMEYEYFKVRSRKDLPTVVVDFPALFSEDSQISDIPLMDGDEIVIPLFSPTVFVTGHVKMPGLIKFVAGKDHNYYIEQAGGYAWNAHRKKQRLLKAETNRWIRLDGDDIVIEVGDTIFVPEKKESDYWLLFKEFLLVASQLATLIIVLRTI